MSQVATGGRQAHLSSYSHHNNSASEASRHNHSIKCPQPDPAWSSCDISYCTPNLLCTLNTSPFTHCSTIYRGCIDSCTILCTDHLTHTNTLTQPNSTIFVFVCSIINHHTALVDL